MKPVFLTLILMLGLPSAFAAERYTEVWNPPEAKMTKGKSKPHGTAQTAQAAQAAQAATRKKHKSATSVKQVADKTIPDQQADMPAHGKNAPRQSEPVIPRIIGPNGVAMQV